MTHTSPLDQFLKDVDEPRRSQLRELHEFIGTHAPKLQPYIEGKFLGYGKYHYKYASGREGEWFTLGIGNNKGSIAVYCMCNENGRYLTEKYADKLHANVGKSCIRFKKFEHIDWDVLAQLFQEAQEKYEPEQITT